MPGEDNLKPHKGKPRINTTLPVLPSGVAYLLKALNNNEIHYKQLAIEIEKYPSIAIKIVSIANSAWSLPQQPITTLSEACSRIGLNMVRSISVALSISQVFNPALCTAFSAKKFWISALLNAEAAFICAKSTPEICPSTARLAGLLHNIGLLWLANQRPAETKNALLEIKDNQTCSLASVLYQRLDTDYYEIGGQLAMAMELPEVIIEIISTKTASGLVNKNALIKNHCYAKQLTASAIFNMETADEALSEFNEDPNYQKIGKILPKIITMSESMFPY